MEKENKTLGFGDNTNPWEETPLSEKEGILYPDCRGDSACNCDCHWHTELCSDCSKEIPAFWKDDVKQALKRLQERINESPYRDVHKEIKEIFGEKLLEEAEHD